MREILFRGKRSDNGNWICGSLFTRVNEAYIIPLPIITSKSKVDPDTVGQFTGLTDMNGKKIFEGDIIRAHTGRILTVEFGQHFDEENCSYAYGWFVYDNEGEISLGEEWGGHEVIGNIHDNPELLEVEDG